MLIGRYFLKNYLQPAAIFYFSSASDFGKLFLYKMIDLEFYKKIVETIAVGEDVKNRLTNAIQEAFENPKSFYDENDEYVLAWRGMDFSSFKHLTPKFVLIDMMIAADQMAEIDWKEEEEEIRHWINKILRSKKYSFQLPNDDLYENTDTYTALKAINENELKPNGFSLEILDIDSDSYVFTIVSLDKQQIVAEMFAKLK